MCAAAGLQSHREIGIIHGNPLAVVLDHVNLVFPVSAALNGHGTCLDGVDVHQVHIEPVSIDSIDQRRHVFRNTGPSTLRIEVPEPAM